MNANAFRHFYDYHFTENRKIWDSYITPLPHEQFTQDVDYSRGSVRNQIVHLMSVDGTWFSGLRSVEIPESLNPANSHPRFYMTKLIFIISLSISHRFPRSNFS